MTINALANQVQIINIELASSAITNRNISSPTKLTMCYEIVNP
jgi:hypothetical protein